MKVVFIDTVLLAGLTDPQIRSFPPHGPKSLKIAEDQWTWINQTLAEYSKIPGWTIVVGHYPGVWMCGCVGSCYKTCNGSPSS